MKNIYSILLLLLFSQLGFAQSPDKSGVKTNTISLPSGPGSIEGLGESFQPSLNTGQANYSVGLIVPPGTAGHTPELSLSYNGGGGNGPLGYGWSINLPHIQRQSEKGIPHYVDQANGLDDDYDGVIDNPEELDVFINEMNEELVESANGYYLCENEGAFIRYKRVGEHWEANLPDGTLLEFGITENARIIDEASLNVHCWLLEKMTDTNGNVIKFSYRTFGCLKDLNQKYLHKVEYGAGAPPWEASHFVELEYEDRFDWFEDCRAGFKVRTGQRLTKVYIGTQGVTLDGHQAGDFNFDGRTDYLNRMYELEYDTHPHWSLLSKVTWIGSDGQKPYPPISFQYTTNTPADTISAKDKILGEQGAPFQLMDNPLVDLVDLNGDALPDLLSTDQFGGTHNVHINQGQNGNVIQWASGENVASEDGLAWNINLQDDRNAIAHLADMDADGLSDLVYKVGFGDVYYFKNKGNKSWGKRTRMNAALGEVAPPSPFGEANVKTADIDFDKRIDLIQSISVGGGFYYRIWFNRGAQQYSNALTVPQEFGFDLSNRGVHIADFNGDRVPDILWIRPNGITVTAGLGHGHFDDPIFVPMPDIDLTDDLIQKSNLQDINGDGLMDLIIHNAEPNRLWYWLNLGNYSLDRLRFIKDMPTMLGFNPSIRWADINGNGTTDFIYTNQFAFPRMQTVDIGELIGAVPSPNLLVEVDNGIGQQTKLEYATSIKFALEDRANGKEWPDPLPFSLQVVTKSTLSDGMGNEYVNTFAFHNGYYDQKDKMFRGFGQVESRDIGDASAPDLIMAYEFNTGNQIEALKGKQLSEEARNAAGEVFYRATNTWQTKVLHESATGDGRKTTYPYLTTKLRNVVEKGNGMPVQLQWDYEYDDYGNQTKQIEYGRLDEGWNDERITHAIYTAAFEDGLNRWILNKPVEQLITDELDTLVAHTKNYYDSNLELGKITKSNLTRVENWVDSNKYIISSRNDFDAFGNTIAIYDPLYGTQAGHYRELHYDPHFQTFPEAEIIHTGKRDPSTLVVEAAYDYGYGKMLSSIDFNDHASHYKYDIFARLVTITKPLDTFPTVKYDYVLAHPLANGNIVNWTETSSLDNSEGDGYLHSRTYFDGLERELMTRAEGEFTGQVVVTGTTIFNGRGIPCKKYLPYFELGTLDFQAPSFQTGYTEHFYDALKRPVRLNQPTSNDESAFSTILYEPLSVFVQDEEQTNPSSIHFGCGERRLVDGLKDKDDQLRIRQVLQRVKLSDEGEPLDNFVDWKLNFDYDLLDNITQLEDFQSNQSFFAFDGLSRITSANDPNSGTMSYFYDDASNLIRTLDTKDQTIRYDYDGINRMKAEYYSADAENADVNYHYDTPFGVVNKGELWTSADRTTLAQNTLGQLAWVQDQSGESHTSYDERGRTTWTVKRIGSNDLQNFYTGFQYDPMDRVTQLTYPDESVLAYAYNTRGLVENVPNIIDRYDYNPVGFNALLELHCGTVSQYNYDHRLRLKALQTERLRDTLQLQDLSYAFDGMSNILQITDVRPDVAINQIGAELGMISRDAQKFNASQQFEYDNLYRLTKAYNVQIYGTLNFRYDRIGNMLSKTADLLEASPGMNVGNMTSGGSLGTNDRVGYTPNVPGPNAISGITQGDVNFVYDGNGNMLNDGTIHYHWDFKNRLEGIEKEEIQSTYRYDYNNARRLKVVEDTVRAIYIDKFSEIRAGELIKYVYAANNRVASIAEDTTFFLYDHLGTTSLALNQQARVQDQTVHYPYGLTRKEGHETSTTDYSFRGKEQDKESDNFYLDDRYYSPVNGRFLTATTLGETAYNLSPYSGFSNNPMTYYDPINYGFETSESSIRFDSESLNDRKFALSFASNTEVLTTDSVKYIQDIAVGDEVVGYDEKTGTTGVYEVSQVFQRTAPVMLHIGLAEDTIVVTPEHPFYTTNGWLNAIELHKGDWLVQADGDSVAVAFVDQQDGLTTVYNFEVEGVHNYFVSKFFVLVHNPNLSNIAHNNTAPPPGFASRMDVTADANTAGANTGTQTNQTTRTHVNGVAPVPVQYMLTADYPDGTQISTGWVQDPPLVNTGHTRYDAGHMFARQNGGPGNRIDLVFPQNPAVNRGNQGYYGDWRRYERRINRELVVQGAATLTFSALY